MHILKCLPYFRQTTFIGKHRCHLLAVNTAALDFSASSVVKNPLANAGDVGLILGFGRSLGKKMATHSSILAWEIPWTEELCGPQSMGSQKNWAQQ